MELDKGNNKEYELKAICNSTVYASKSKSYLLRLQYLALWKSYFKEENTWEPVLIVLHLCKLVNAFHIKHSKKPIATFPPIDSVLPIAKQIVKPATKK